MLIYNDDDDAIWFITQTNMCMYYVPYINVEYRTEVCFFYVSRLIETNLFCSVSALCVAFVYSLYFFSWLANIRLNTNYRCVLPFEYYSCYSCYLLVIHYLQEEKTKQVTTFYYVSIKRKNGYVYEYCSLIINSNTEICSNPDDLRIFSHICIK